MSSADSIYSPDTAGTAAAEQALVVRQQELQQLFQAEVTRRKEEQAELNRERQQLEQQKQTVLWREAENWTEADRLRTERSSLQHELAIVQRDRDVLAKRAQEIQLREDSRRRNRTRSAAYIEDSFTSLSPRGVVEHLTDSSPRIRKHVMDNVSTCINDFKGAKPPLVRFKPDDIAPFLLPKLHQLVSVPNKPVDSVMQFAEDVVSSPPMAKALALWGGCPQLADYLIQKNDYVNRLAISSLRQMIRSDARVVKTAYDALARVVPVVPIPESSSDPYHPAVAFIEEMAPKIIGDCFNNSLWKSISPLATHRIDSIRRVALQKIIFEAQHSDRTRHGLVEANTLSLLDQEYQLPSPPSDIVDFFVNLLPLLADKICRRTDTVLWLLCRLGDPTPKINAAVIEALRTCSMKQDVTIHDVFVEVELLRRLDEPSTQPSYAINKLICELLPVLAIPHARKKQLSKVIGFLDHAETAVSNACLTACIKIVDSTVEDRACLYSVFSKLDFAKESSLKLCDYAMPVFCKDWAAAGDFTEIAKLLSHAERRIRTAAHRVWNDAISNTPAARAKVVRDDLLGVIFELCSSPYEDCIVVGCQSVPHMAIEVVKAGTGFTRQLVSLLSHPRVGLRQAALQAIHLICESNNSNCDVLLAADAFNVLKQALEANSLDDLDTSQKILVRLAPFLSKSSDACSGLLQLLDSKNPQVESATRAALASISYTNIEYRETLRNVILDRLLLASDVLIEYTAQAIQDWIGPDLAQLNDFTTFFELVSHSHRRIQTGALFALRQRISNREYQDSLERANVVFLIRSLSSSTDNPEAISFVAFALPSLGLTLASNGHVDVILQLLTSGEPQIREGASAAIESIANGSTRKRKYLLDADILERLIGSDAQVLGQTELQLSSTIIPKLALDYVRAGKVDLILTLVDHHQQHIRVAANRSVAAIVGGTLDDRTRLRHALLSRLNGATPALREVAANCLSRVLARDLVSDGDYIQLFRLFKNEDPRIRAPVIAELRTFIQSSDETVRRRIVDANILPAILQADKHGKDDLIIFTADCILPVLGPSFSQNDGGSSIIPLLLSHGEPRIRAAAATAIRGGVDSRHGNVKNVAGTGIISKLHSAIDRDDAIRDLWCYLLPKAAPFLSVRAEIDILFESLSDHREIVRQSAVDAIGTMAKTSEEARLNLFPALMHRLDDPPDYALRTIAQAVSLSGSAFISSGNEAELLHIIEYGNPALVAAAVDAITQLLSKGSVYEHEKLMGAEVFLVAIRLHRNPSQRQLSLKLLYSIVSHLSHAIVLDKGLAEELLSLFDDPDSHLSQTLCQSLASDPRVSRGSTFLELLPMLLDAGRVRNPSVCNLLRHLAPDMVPRLIDIRRVDILVRALSVKEPTVTRAYLQEIRVSANDATEDEKDWLSDEPQFLPVLSNYLKSRDVTLRRISSEIVEVLSNKSPFRSGRMMTEGIGSSLAWVSVNGEKGAQHASIHALATLFSAAPDHADQLVLDSLPALCDILEDVYRSLEVYTASLGLLTDIARQSSHSIIIESGITGSLIEWLSPQHSITNTKCRQSVFQICQLIAQNSDPGRKALLDDGILPVLLRLATNHIASNVVNACKILDALAHTGTYREELITAGVKISMQQITSPFRKSSLNNKLEKKQALDAAKQVLTTLQSTKNLTPATIDSPNVPKSVPLRMNQSVSMMPMINANMNAPDQETTRVHLGRSVSESATADTMHQHEEIGLDSEWSFVPQTPTRTRHVRRSTDPGAGGLQTRLNRSGLSEIRENRNDADEPSESYLSNDEVETRQGISRVGARFGEPSEPQASERLGESSGRLGGSSARDTSDHGGRRSVKPPSYRTMQSMSAMSRRSYRPT